MNELEEIRDYVKNTHIVYTLVRSVSRSGLSRRISLFAVSNGELISLDWLMTRAGLSKRRGDQEGLYVEGVGMDMAFYTVYRLSLALYGDGYKLTKQDI